MSSNAAAVDPVVISALPSYIFDLAVGTLSYAKTTVTSRVSTYRDLAVNTTETAVKTASETAQKAREVLLDNFNPAKYDNSLTRTLVGGTVASLTAAKTAVSSAASASFTAAHDVAVDQAQRAKELVLDHPLVAATHNVIASNPYGAYAIQAVQSGVKVADEYKSYSLGKISEIQTGTLSKFYELKQGAVSKVVELKDGAITRIFEVKEGALSYVVDLSNGAVSRVTSVKDGLVAKVVELKDSSVARVTTYTSSLGDVAFGYAVAGTSVARKAADTGLSYVQSTSIGSYALATSQKILAEPLVQSAVGTGLDTATYVAKYALSFPYISAIYATSEDVVKKVLAASEAAVGSNDKPAAANGKHNGH